MTTINRTAKIAALNDALRREPGAGEHDFGSFEMEGQKLFWKIDYFEKGSDYLAGAETPENAETTDRLLTIMLAGEY